MSMQLQYSRTIQVYIVILWLEKIQPNVWKMHTRAVFKCLIKAKQVVRARLGPFASWVGSDNAGIGMYIYIYHISKHSLSQVYNMHTEGK